MDQPYPKSVPARVATPFLGGAMRKATREELELLRAYVEGASAQLDVRPERR